MDDLRTFLSVRIESGLKLREIARNAYVSASTISRILNNPDFSVNIRTANKILGQFGYMVAINKIGQPPIETADVAEVKRGEWERMINPYGELEGFMCECGHQSQAATNYCPNCGALNNPAIK